MAYQLFAEGKDTGWGRIHYKIEHETTREGTKIGIRYKITWTIDQEYFFGFNIVANVWTEGQNYGRQIKGNTPNRGSGVAYFPKHENEYLWFEKGYSNNDINGCRIIINSTNGGNVPFDTAPSPENPDEIIKAPTGYVASSISSNIDFDIGDNLNIQISDITNIGYTYKLYMDVYNENNQWQNVKLHETSSKNFIYNVSDISEILYNILPTRNNTPIRIRLETRFSNVLIGSTIKSGICRVTNSNPDLPIFNLVYFNDWLNENQIEFVNRGFSPYNPYNNTFLRIRKPQNLQGENGAILTQYIFKSGNTSADIDIQTLATHPDGIRDGDDNSQYVEVLVSSSETGEDIYNSYYSLTVVDSRGNSTTRSFTCQVAYFIPPYFTKTELKRVDGVSKTVKLYAEGKYVHGYDVSTKPTIKYKSFLATDDYNNDDNTTDWLHNILASQITMIGDGRFTVDATLEFKDVGQGFDVERDFNVKFYLYIPPMPSYAPNTQVVFLSKGKSLIYYSKEFNAISIGKKYDPTIGGELQVAGGVSVRGVDLSRCNMLPSGDNSLAYWQSIKQGTYFCRPNTVTGQPQNWGIVVVQKTEYDTSGDGNIMWYTQSQGPIYRKSYNANGVTDWISINDDTGWINASYRSGYTFQASNAQLQYRVKNGILYTRGSVTPTSGGFTHTGYVQVADFPSHLFNNMPSAGYDTAILAPSGGGSYPARCYFGNDGTLHVSRIDTSKNTPYVTINVVFPID